MDERLLELRARSYSMGVVYDRTFQACCDAFLHLPNERLMSAVAAFNQAASAYGASLHILLEHLATLKQTRATEAEANRTSRILGLLDNEIEIVNDRYAHFS